MSKLSLFLIITAAFLIGSIIATGLVWYLLVIKPLQEAREHASEQIEVVREVVEEGVDIIQKTQATKTDETLIIENDLILNEPIYIPLEQLTQAQQKLARTLGVVKDEMIVISPETETCAREKLGSERVDAIVAGESPSLSEGIALMGCL